MWMTRLETACRQQVAGQSGSRELNFLSEEVIQKTIEQGRGGAMGESPDKNKGFLGQFAKRTTWESLLRKLERERGTSYRT